MYEFKKNAVTLAEHGEWELVIYGSRTVSLLKKDETEIMSLSCTVEDNDNGCVKDEAILLDKLGDLYLAKVKECERLKKKFEEES